MEFDLRGVDLVQLHRPEYRSRRETITIDWKIALIVIVVGTLLGLSAAERVRRLCAVGNRRRWPLPK
jgi:hypothetical protein